MEDARANGPERPWLILNVDLAACIQAENKIVVRGGEAAVEDPTGEGGRGQGPGTIWSERVRGLRLRFSP